MDDVTFRAGVSLLDADAALELQRLMDTIRDPEIRHTTASAFIRARVDAVELVRTAAAVRAGLLKIDVPPFGPSASGRHPPGPRRDPEQADSR